MEKQKQVLVSHLDGIQRAFIKEDAANGEFLIGDSSHPPTSADQVDCLFTETQGSNLRDVLVNPFVDGHRTYSNDISEIFQVLGLEAAITSIVREIQQGSPSSLGNETKRCISSADLLRNLRGPEASAASCQPDGSS